MSYLIPPNGRANEILPTDKLCKDSQQEQKQTDGSPRLKAAGGSFVALRYQENGHVSIPEGQLGKPENRGTVYIYGTTEPKVGETLLDIHKVWNKDGSGGDKRGVLLAEQPYDDGQCYQINGGKISATRQKEFGHPANQLQGLDLWCQNDVKLPADAPSGKPYTLYWVWDWPTVPGGDPGLPKGKAEIYTTCMDVDITETNQQKSVGGVARYADDQPIENAAIKSYMNVDAAAPSAPAASSSPQASPVASTPTSSVMVPAPSAPATSTVAAVSVIADGQPQAPLPTTSQAPPAVSPAPAPSAQDGITTIFVTKTVLAAPETPTATTATVLVVVSNSSSAPSVPSPSATATLSGRGSAKFRNVRF